MEAGRRRVSSRPRTWARSVTRGFTKSFSGSIAEGFARREGFTVADAIAVLQS